MGLAAMHPGGNFARPDAYDEWLQWSVGDLRREVGIRAQGAVNADAAAWRLSARLLLPG